MKTPTHDFNLTRRFVLTLIALGMVLGLELRGVELLLGWAAQGCTTWVCDDVVNGTAAMLPLCAALVGIAATLVFTLALMLKRSVAHSRNASV